MDYSGHFPTPSRRSPFSGLRALPTFPEDKTPIQKLIDEMMEQNDIDREKILRNLIENPGVVATFGEDFVVEFAPMELNTLEPSPEDRNLNEYRLEIVQKWRIRRRREEDDRLPLGGNSGGEAPQD